MTLFNNIIIKLNNKENKEKLLKIIIVIKNVFMSLTKFFYELSILSSLF